MSTAKLVMEFTDAGGSNRKWSYNYADTEVSSASVKALADGMIANGSIYEHPPVKAVSAKIVVTTEKSFDVEDE